jgi:hypothetical protein
MMLIAGIVGIVPELFPTSQTGGARTVPDFAVYGWIVLTLVSLGGGTLGLVYGGGVRAFAGQLMNCGTVLILFGVLGLLSPFLEDVLADYPPWQVFELAAERLGSMTAVSIVAIASGVGFVLIGFGIRSGSV